MKICLGRNEHYPLHLFFFFHFLFRIKSRLNGWEKNILSQLSLIKLPSFLCLSFPLLFSLSITMAKGIEVFWPVIYHKQFELEEIEL